MYSNKIYYTAINIRKRVWIDIFLQVNCHQKKNTLLNKKIDCCLASDSQF